MILNPEWLKPKEKPYFHQISLDCLEKLVKLYSNLPGANSIVDISKRGLSLIVKMSVLNIY
jgi:hypothetical protein